MKESEHTVNYLDNKKATLKENEQKVSILERRWVAPRGLCIQSSRRLTNCHADASFCVMSYWESVRCWHECCMTVFFCTSYFVIIPRHWFEVAFLNLMNCLPLQKFSEANVQSLAHRGSIVSGPLVNVLEHEISGLLQTIARMRLCCADDEHHILWAPVHLVGSGGIWGVRLFRWGSGEMWVSVVRLKWWPKRVKRRVRSWNSPYMARNVRVPVLKNCLQRPNLQGNVEWLWWT